MKNLMQPDERDFAGVMTRLVTCNHFLPERIVLEREALGPGFVEDASAVWNLNGDSGARNPNILRLTEKTRATVERLHRSEEHTSELQSLRHLVCRLLLE